MSIFPGQIVQIFWLKYGESISLVFYLARLSGTNPMLPGTIIGSVFLLDMGEYSCPSLVCPNTEELISRPFLDENSIRQLFWDRVNPWPAAGGLALLQLQLCLQLQQNTMVPVDVDGQICHFCSQVFVPCHKYLWTKVTNLTIHINGNHGVLLKL